MDIVDEAKELIPWLDEDSLVTRMAKEIELLRRDNKFLNEENFDVMRKNAELVITLNQTIDSIDKSLKILLEVDMLSAERVKDLVAKTTGDE